ncbi:hypothetical protein TrST_g11661 [Triparma strigata]|uniref:Uncharacterized protein n=1 Tax=Triparma strigata TaxID=1606541 RepID=A0A9W7EM43_9STRA|nr:hypothetical protein TrST_g11661 [Triparma strigata]
MLSEVSSRRLTSPPAHLLSSSQLRSLNKSKYWKCNITSSSFLDVPAPACRKTLPRESEVVVEALKDYGGTDLIGNEGGEEYKPEWLGCLESSVFGYVCSGGEGGEGEGEGDDSKRLDDLLKPLNPSASAASTAEKKEKEIVKTIFGYSVDLTKPPSPPPVVEPLSSTLKPVSKSVPSLNPPPQWTSNFSPSIVGLIPSSSQSLNASASKIQLWFKRTYINWALKLRKNHREKIEQLQKIQLDKERMKELYERELKVFR